jgi:hypothetical protein
METRDVLARPNCLLRGRLAPLGPQYGGSLAHLTYIDGLGDNRELRVRAIGLGVVFLSFSKVMWS